MTRIRVLFYFSGTLRDNDVSYTTEATFIPDPKQFFDNKNWLEKETHVCYLLHIVLGVEYCNLEQTEEVLGASEDSTNKGN